MRDPLRRLLHRGLEVSGLIGPLHRRQERRHAELSSDPYQDGLPMPPAALIGAVAGTGSQRWYSEKGKQDATWFISVAASHGATWDGARVWDLGCGCGRIARWIAPDVLTSGGDFLGTDINRALVGWCDANLPGRYLRNSLQPPVKRASGDRDLVYAYSVFTHLRETAIRSWLAEIARVLRPGGLAMLTFHDEAYAAAWGPESVRVSLQSARLVIFNDALEGSNYLSTWIRRSTFIALAEEHFSVLEIVPGRGDEPVQALAVLQKRS